MTQKTIEECLEKLWHCYRWIKKLEIFEDPEEGIAVNSAFSNIGNARKTCEACAQQLSDLLASKIGDVITAQLQTLYFPMQKKNAAKENRPNPEINAILQDFVPFLKETKMEIPDDLAEELWQKKTVQSEEATEEEEEEKK